MLFSRESRIWRARLAKSLALIAVLLPSMVLGGNSSTRVGGLPPMPMRDTLIALSAQDATIVPHLNYYGGRILANVKVVSVFWGSNVSSDVKSGIGDFYAAMTGSAFFDWLSEYSTTGIIPVGGGQGSNQTLGHGTFAGSYTITPSNSAVAISDADIQAELVSQVKAGHLPAPDSNTYYAVFFPAGITITENGSTSCQQFCAYHSTIDKSVIGSVFDIYYGVHPDLAPPSACSLGCGTATTTFDNVTSVASHELFGAVTDPEVGLSTSLGPPFGWYDPQGSDGEIGDICNGQQASFISSSGTTYTAQKEWSNASGACIATDADAFSMGITPGAATLVQGSTATYMVATSTLRGVTNDIALDVSGLPSGVTGAFQPTSVTEGGSSTLTLTASPSAPLGSATFTVTGACVAKACTSGVTASVTVQPPPNDFALSVSPSVEKVSKKGKALYLVSTVITAGSAQTVNLSIHGLPSGATEAFFPASINTGRISILYVTLGKKTPPGDYAFSVTATGTLGITATHTTIAQLVVP